MNIGHFGWQLNKIPAWWKFIFHRAGILFFILKIYPCNECAYPPSP